MCFFKRNHKMATLVSSYFWLNKCYHKKTWQFDTLSKSLPKGRDPISPGQWFLMVGGVWERFRRASGSPFVSSWKRRVSGLTPHAFQPVRSKCSLPTLYLITDSQHWFSFLQCSLTGTNFVKKFNHQLGTSVKFSRKDLAICNISSVVTK